MKFKTGLVILMTALLVVACASPAASTDTMMEDEAAMEAEVMDDSGSEAMESEEAMQDDASMEKDAAMEADVAMEDNAMMTEVSFNQDVWPIIEEYALNAHGGKGGVFLESYEDILNYVTPGDPENSMLYKALTGNGAPQMPPDGPLPDAMIQTVYDWIAQGAQNN